jgi:hypothetical protein
MNPRTLGERGHVMRAVAAADACAQKSGGGARPVIA